MRDFEHYLGKLGHSEKTIITKTNEAVHFTDWFKGQGTTPIEVDYRTCLRYIAHLKERGNTVKTINHKLAHLRNYFDYLTLEGHRMESPIEKTIIRGEKPHRDHELLTTYELEDLYHSFGTDLPADTTFYNRMAAKRDRTVVGLLVHQGLDTKDFRGLRLEHLKLDRGKIYVPARRRSNARELQLRPWQVRELREYVEMARPVLIRKVKRPVHHDQLFPYGEQFTLVGILVKKLRAYNQKVRSAKQLRASVIVEWLERHDLREVQYMAGHKHISSTEGYVQDDLEGLREIVENFHPMNRT